MVHRWEAAARAARAIAHEAGILAANMQAGVTARDKGGDLGPVTDADIAVEALILRRLDDAFPGDAILSEETHAEPTHDAPTLWCVDPIDGTREYVQQLDEYAVQIGVLHEGQPVAGAFALPKKRVVYWGWLGGGAWRDDQPIDLAPCPPTPKATLIHTRSRVGSALDKAVVLLNPAQRTMAGGVGYKVSHVLEQTAHLYLHTGPGTTWWDTVGPAAVLRAAGGVVSDARGEPLDYAHDKRHQHGLLFGLPGAEERVRAARRQKKAPGA